MRIFWLGAHKLLVKTELHRLRELGYEVYNPPYNTPVPDQSAHLNWDKDQTTTLPKNVFNKLSEYNFFYNPIDDEIAKILNKYFDAVVVTIHPWWLSEVLKIYQGKVIYRTYGQLEILSQELVNYEGITQILNRDNFYFLPFHEKTVSDEDAWLKDKAIVVPYCLDPSIEKRKGNWLNSQQKNKQMMVTCPNINNPFYLDHYYFLKKNFSEPHYLFFGVQLAEINDPQIMGTIPYEQLQKYFSDSAGFLYSYSNPRVCYLPPIEMMSVGGPVIYPKGCLLDLMIKDGRGSGSYSSVDEAKVLTQRLFDNDQELIKTLQSEQRSVVDYYSPQYVWPIFDKIMKQILEEDKTEKHVHSETVFVRDYKAARDFALSKEYSKSCLLLTRQDILDKYALFRLERRIRIHKLRNSIVAFSKRIEAGEFVKSLLRSKEFQSVAQNTSLSDSGSSLHPKIKQGIYLMLRVRDRLRSVLIKVKNKMKIIYGVFRHLFMQTAFFVWFGLNSMKGKKTKWLS